MGEHHRYLSALFLIRFHHIWLDSMERLMGKISQEASFDTSCSRRGILKFLFALCCSNGASRIEYLRAEMKVAIQKVQELANAENTPLSGHLSS
jgi:hypothetical protein